MIVFVLTARKRLSIVCQVGFLTTATELQMFGHVTFNHASSPDQGNIGFKTSEMTLDMILSTSASPASCIMGHRAPDGTAFQSAAPVPLTR